MALLVEFNFEDSAESDRVLWDLAKLAQDNAYLTYARNIQYSNDLDMMLFDASGYPRSSRA